MPKLKHRVTIFAFVTNVESRIIELTQSELDEFKSGNCGERIEKAMWNDEGEFVESSTSCIDADQWEVVTQLDGTPVSKIGG